ncbi:MAG: WD40 repeat domain-containing protein [Actinomycetota bacterium]
MTPSRAAPRFGFTAFVMAVVLVLCVPTPGVAGPGFEDAQPGHPGLVRCLLTNPGLAPGAWLSLCQGGVSAPRATRPSTPGSDLPACTAVAGVNDRCPAWVASYDDPDGHAGGGWDLAVAEALSPSGDRLYVAGYSKDDATGYDMLTLAYDTSTGQQVWMARADSGADDFANALVVSPDGARVYVGGAEDVSPGGGDSALVAYDAATGGELWTATHDGPAGQQDAITALAVSPSGDRVYATGVQDEKPGACFNTAGCDIETIGYDAATGEERWGATVDGDGEPGNDADSAAAIAVSPDGNTVYVGGTIDTTAPRHEDFVALAYSARDEQHEGDLQWQATYNGSVAGYFDYDYGTAMALSPDGGTLYLTGGSDPGTPPIFGSLEPQDDATVAFDTRSGEQRWAARYRGAFNGWNLPYAIAAAPTGDLFVTGVATGPGTLEGTVNNWDVGTVAYGASGVQLWSDTYGWPGNLFDYGTGLAISPDGRALHVSGVSGTGELLYIGTTVAGTFSPPAAAATIITYDTTTGARSWVGRYGAPDDDDFAFDIALSLDGRRAFVTGAAGPFNAGVQTGSDPTNHADVLTLAYDTSP